MANFLSISLWTIFGLAMSFILPSQTIDYNVEDEYIEHFGNSPPLLRRWHPLREVFLSKDIRRGKIVMLCQTCHSLAGKGSLNKDHLQLGMNVRKLVFKNSTYNPVNVEMLWYLVYETGKTKTADMQYHYLIEGQRSGCVYYVTPAKEMRQFHLDHHVCGVPISLLSKSKVHEPELVPA